MKYKKTSGFKKTALDGQILVEINKLHCYCHLSYIQYTG